MFVPKWVSFTVFFYHFHLMWAWKRLTLQNESENVSSFFTPIFFLPGLNTGVKNERRKTFQAVMQEICLQVKDCTLHPTGTTCSGKNVFEMMDIKKYNGEMKKIILCGTHGGKRSIFQGRKNSWNHSALKFFLSKFQCRGGRYNNVHKPQWKYESEVSRRSPQHSSIKSNRQTYSENRRKLGEYSNHKHALKISLTVKSKQSISKGNWRSLEMREGVKEWGGGGGILMEEEEEQTREGK